MEKKRERELKSPQTIGVFGVGKRAKLTSLVRSSKTADTFYLNGRIVCSLKEKEEIEKNRCFSPAFGVLINQESFQRNTGNVPEIDHP
jgi:hypothetical protein